MMLKLTTILLIVPLLSTQAVFVTRWSEIGLPKIPCPVKVKDKFVIVGWKNDNTLFLKGEPSSEIGSCEIPVTVRDSQIASPRIVARALGNGKIVVSFTKVEKDNVYPVSVFVVISLQDCSSKVIEIAGEKGAVRHHPIPVTFHDTFELFPSMEPGSPKLSTISRYNDNGEKLEVLEKFDPERDFTGYNVRVKAIDDQNQSKGYIVGINNEDGAYLNLLSSKLKWEKQIYQKDSRLVSLSTDYGNITTCQINESRPYCNSMDQYLNSNFEVPLEAVKNGTLIDIWVTNLPDGSAVALLQNVFLGIDEDNWDEAIHGQRILKNGMATDTLAISRTQNTHTLPIAFVMDNGEFCITAVVINGKYIVEESELKSDFFVSCTKYKKN